MNQRHLLLVILLSFAILVTSIKLFGYYAGLNSLPIMAFIILGYDLVFQRWRWLWIVIGYLLLYILLSLVTVHPSLA
jgi:hypothetical protein